MRKRLADWILWREERWLWVPRRVLRWAFDYIFAHGIPVTFAARPRVVVTSCHPLIEVNPAPRTWATGTQRVVITHPTSPDNPYA